MDIELLVNQEIADDSRQMLVVINKQNDLLLVHGYLMVGYLMFYV
jgi:hypothetical protein